MNKPDSGSSDMCALQQKEALKCREKKIKKEEETALFPEAKVFHVLYLQNHMIML